MDDLKGCSDEDLRQRLLVLTGRMRRLFIRAVMDEASHSHIRGWDLAEINEYFCLDLLPYYAYNVLVLKAIPKTEQAAQQIPALMEELEGHMRAGLRLLFHESELASDGNLLVCVFNITTHRDSRETRLFKLGISRLFAEICTAHDHRAFAFVMGEGVPVPHVRELGQCFRSALQAAESGIVSGLDQKYDSNELLHTLGDLLSVLTPARKAALRRSMETADPAGLRGQIGAVLRDGADYIGTYPCLAGQLPRAIADLCAAVIRDRLPSGQAPAEAAEIQRRLDRCLDCGEAEQVCLDALPALLRRYEALFTAGRKQPVEEAMRYIRANLAHRLTLADIAGHVGLNPQYLSGLFRRETGMVLTDHITQVRLEQAKLLLRHSDRTIQQIAEAVGFQDPKYFSRRFKRSEGVSPRTYRNELR